MAVIIVKHRTVATLFADLVEDVGMAQFVVSDDDGRVLDTLALRADVWEDMGRPETVTISVEPGDLLNS